MGNVDPLHRRTAAKPAHRLSLRERRQRRDKLLRALVIALLGITALLLGLLSDRPLAWGRAPAPAAAGSEAAASRPGPAGEILGRAPVRDGRAKARSEPRGCQRAAHLTHPRA